MAGKSSVVTIKDIRGSEETRRFLLGLGFNEGSEVTVINEIDGNLIVKVKDARIAVTKAMANHIIVG